MGNKTYGDPEFTLSASGGSGSGAVTFESSDPTVISISGATATIHKAGGPVTITATKAEDENYNAASDTLNVTVAKKAVVFRANDKTVQQGGTMPAFDYAPVTLAQGDSIATEPTAACTATNTNIVGTFTITLSGAVLTNGDSYEISYQPGTLTVTAQSTYTVTVNGGTGGGSYAAGDTVTITSTVPSGQRFTGWTVNAGGTTLANASSATTTFTMPAQAVTVTADFENIPVPTFFVTVNGGTGGGSYAAGDTVTITSTVPSGQRFTGWTVNAGGVTLANASNATTTFTMPAQAVTVTANFQSNSSGGSSSGGGGGSYTPPTTYPPTVERPSEGGGTAAVSPSNPKPGDTVTVKPRPDDGYEVDKITVTDKDGKPVEVTVRPDGTYTFKQPNGKVKIEGSYKAVEKSWNNPFSDVSEDDWYYEAVRFAHERNLMNGYSDGRFGPNDPLSRAQLAQILFNKEGRPGVDYLLDFSDVAGEAWYTEAVRWAVSHGIVGGYGNGTFGPNDPITREQLAVMLWRYSGSPAATNKELHFNDTDEISGFALEALCWAVENGILNGYGDGRLGPQGQATRAQVAQMLKNFIENQEANT
ncbi:S-layer homology domain-containing protein [Oscillospiraceae bacterium 38-13]